jgi:hypothetical protein
MNGERERFLKVIVACFKKVSRHLSEETEEIDENAHLG